MLDAQIEIAREKIRKIDSLTQPMPEDDLVFAFTITYGYAFPGSVFNHWHKPKLLKKS